MGAVFSLYAGSKYMVVLNSRESLHEALVTRANDYADRPPLHVEHTANPNSYGIAFSSFNANYKHRKQVTLSILKQFGFGKQIMETRILMEVEKMVECIRDINGKSFNPHDIISGYVSNVVTNILFGRRFNIDDPTFMQMIDDARNAFYLWSPEIDIFPILRLLPSYKRKIADGVNRFKRLLTFVEANTEACLRNETDPDNFVNTYIEIEGADYDKRELAYILRDLTFAGSDTSSTTLLWCLILLANNRPVQECIQVEIDSIVGRDHLPRLDDRKRLPYLEATLAEIMRLKTIVPFAGGLHVTTCDTQVQGLFIPAGTMVVLNQFAANMDPDFWDQPELFRPERFLDQSGNFINSEKATLFSLGKRSCLGEQLARQQLFLFVTSILQNFVICPPEGQDRIDDTWAFMTIVAPNDYTVRLIPRQDTAMKAA